jgi:subfamily B ATP-binding cassette protein MsbA
MMLFTYARMFYGEIGNRLVVLFVLLLAAAFFEAVSIGMILPLLQGEGDSVLSRGLNSITNLIGLGDGTTSILILIVVLFFVRGLFMLAQSMYQATIISDHLVKMRTNAVSALFRVKYQYLISRDTGFFTNAITGELERVNFSLRQLGSLLVAATTSFVYLGLIVMFQPIIFLFIVILVVPIAVLATFVNRKTRAASVAHSRRAGEHQSLLVESVQHSKYLMATGQSRAITDRVIDEARRLGLLYRRLMQLNSISLYGFEPFAVFVLAGIVWYYTQELGQPMTEVIFLVLLFFQASKAMLAVQPAYRKFLQSAGSLQLYRDLQSELAENTRTLNPNAVTPDTSGDIEFSNVSVTYPGQDHNALTNVSFIVPARKTIALVGPSGSGKSTIANLLTGLIDPSDGDIKLTGTPYLDLDSDQLKSKIAYVTQESVVFRGSVLENVTMWESDAEFERARDLLGRVGLEHLVGRASDENGLDVKSAGTDISGGERQRLSIARELYRRFDLLILDEATSALDSDLEARIDELLQETRGKATVVVIAHRLSTIRNADIIYVLDAGRIVESGGYDDLVTSGGPFSKMSDSQAL